MAVQQFVETKVITDCFISENVIALNCSTSLVHMNLIFIFVVQVFKCQISGPYLLKLNYFIRRVQKTLNYGSPSNECDEVIWLYSIIFVR